MDVETTKGELEALTGIEPTLSTAIAQILSDAFQVEVMAIKSLLERHLVFCVLLSAAVGLATGSLATIAFRQGPRDPRIFIVGKSFDYEGPAIEVGLPASFPTRKVLNGQATCEDLPRDDMQVAAYHLGLYHIDGDRDGDYCE